MFDLPQKLMLSAQKWHIEGYTGVLGQRTRLQKSSFRVGLWPILGESEPDIAMGIGLILAALLEQRPSVRVYRLLAQVNENPDNYEWELNNSQFGVDDWEVEGLDENAAIWGAFEIRNGHTHFSLEVENDVREDDVTLKLDYEIDTLFALLNLLPSIADKILNWFDPVTSENAEYRYDLVSANDGNVAQELLSHIFYWELDYFLDLWGQPTSQESMLADLEALINLAEKMNSNFAAWIIAQSVSRLMLFDDVSWSQFLVPQVNKTVEALVAYPVVAEVLGITLFRLNYNLEAFELLERTLLLHPKNSVIWNTLGALYIESREDLAAVDVYQRAIEAEAATSETYLQYANIIILLRERQIELNTGNKHNSPVGRPFVDRYIFVDQDETSASLREAAASYSYTFKLDHSNIDSLSRLITCLISLQDESAWGYFQTLVEHDKEGTITASIIEQLSEEDIFPAIETIRKALINDSRQINARINLVRAYLAADDSAQARVELVNISTLNTPLQAQSILTRLRLSANFPDFESRLGEVTDVLQAGGKVSATDAEFLEAMVENEPLFSEGYRLLAASYLSWGETHDALDVLLDGENKAPFDSEGNALLAKVLWDEDQSELAFAYLEKGLKQDGRNAALHSLKGRFLFDEGLNDEAKVVLLIAEEIDPLNSELVATRLHIANVLMETRRD